MTFFDEEISFDTGHLILLLALVGFLLFVSLRCSIKCGGEEGLNVSLPNGVQPMNPIPCHCSACAAAVLEKAQNGELYGCNPNNPYVPYSKEECNYQYHKNMLHGCGIAN